MTRVLRKNGLLEKAVALDMANRIAHNIRLLSKTGDMDSDSRVATMMTRDKDTYVDINSRARMARNAGAQMLISIHNNSWVTGGPNGARVIVSKSGSYRRSSENLGQNILKRLEACGLADKGVKPDQKPWIRFNQLGVLHGVCTDMPAVLIELGYLSNQHDAKLLADPESREVMSVQIAAAALQSLGIEPRMSLLTR